MTTVDKRAIAAAFGRAAAGYGQHDELQRRSAAALLARLPDRSFARVLDAGCGPGSMSRYWRDAGSEVTALDLSPPMLAEARRRNAAHHYLLADIETLELADGQFDLVWSNLALQWCGDLAAALARLQRAVRPGGCLAFTTLAAGSLPELRQAWRAIDDRPHVNRFPPQAAIAAAAGEGGRYQTLLIRQRFADALQAMRSLKGVGATHLHQGRAAQMLTREKLRRLQRSWPQQHGECPLSWRIFTGVIICD